MKSYYKVYSYFKIIVSILLFTVTGICDKLYNCVIGEIGVTNDAGKPYPSSGFTSAFVMAHEIGHNLGMSHDNTAGTLLLLFDDSTCSDSGKQFVNQFERARLWYATVVLNLILAKVWYVLKCPQHHPGP